MDRVFRISELLPARTSPPLHPEPGDRVGDRFEVTGTLGVGGQGWVLSGRDLLSAPPNDVAIKVWKGSSEQRVAREVKILEKLREIQHPGIVRLVDYDVGGGHAYMVMERIDGQPLNEMISRLRELGPADRFSLVARIARDVALALQAAHKHGVVHRDLKTENILISTSERVVLIDFGLGRDLQRSLGSVTQASEVLGTLRSNAPEQFRNNTIGDSRTTDIYQAGIVLYELLTGEYAFSGETREGVIADIRAGRLVWPSNRDPMVPAHLEAICLQATEKDPRRRYQSAGALAHDLQCWLDSKPINARGTSRAMRTLQRYRHGLRTRRARGAVRIAILTVLFVAATLAWHGLRPAAVRITSAWALPEASGTATPLRVDDPVTGGDLLGVDIESDAPVFVYALSISGGPGRTQQYVTPDRPQALDALLGRGGATGESVGDFGLKLPAGGLQVCVVRAENTSEGEGLLVFAATEPLLAVETWFTRVRRVHEETYAGATRGVPRNLAEKLHPQLGETFERGEPLSLLDPEELRRHLKNYPPAAILRGDADAETLARFESWHPVRRVTRGKDH